MNDSLSQQEHYLLKEYDSASQLTYHIDELRNKLTGFFLVFNGLAVGGLNLVVKGEAKNLFEPTKLVALLFFIIGVLGLLVVGILARLRKVQLEHFRIINNIRRYFLKSNEELWRVVELSERTLPLPTNLSGFENRTSGSYFWVLVIIVINSVILVTAAYLYLFRIHSLTGATPGAVMMCIVVLLFVVLQDELYFSLAYPPKHDDIAGPKP